MIPGEQSLYTLMDNTKELAEETGQGFFIENSGCKEDHYFVERLWERAIKQRCINDDARLRTYFFTTSGPWTIATLIVDIGLAGGDILVQGASKRFHYDKRNVDIGMALAFARALRSLRKATKHVNGMIPF